MDNKTENKFLRVFNSWRVWLVTWIMFLLDIFDVRHRVNVKPSWALLIKKAKGKYSKGDYLMASLPMARYVPSADYEEWATRMKELMRGSDVDVSLLWSRPPSRALNFPRRTYGLKEHEELYSFFDVQVKETARERRMLEKAIKYGVSRRGGVDQAWLANPTTVNSSLSRYTIDRPVESSFLKSKVIEAADSLFDDFPEMYDAPRGMTVKSVIAASEWKYSAGLPFLPVIKKRADLKSSAWIHAIDRAASRILASGEYLGTAFHAFPKNQIAAVDSLVDPTNPKPIRTVTAESRINAIAYNTLALERNKRLPPAHALVLPSFARSEGGMVPAYNLLQERKHIFSGDASKFDSTASTTLVVEGPTRLWERGSTDTYGEAATRSFIRAYYEGLADGFIVSLLDGTTIRKTGGGGTGSAPTSTDNRDWVRVVFRAAFSIATGFPASDFSKYFTFANASDDIEFSCDEIMLPMLNKMKIIMLDSYGVNFSFNKEDGPDNLLHLKLKDLDDVDTTWYDRVGLSPANKFAVVHDPARLWLMRSEYRADRMKMVYLVDHDVIATRSVGHAYLCAHQLGSYADVAEDWIDATTSFMSAHFAKIQVVRERDDNGNLISVGVGVLDSKPSEELLQRIARFNPADKDQVVLRAQATARRWYASHRFPSYRRVFSLWVGETEVRGKASVRRYLKLELPPVLSWNLDVARQGAARFQQVLSAIPTALVKMAGEPDFYRVSRVFTSADFLIERYAYYRNAEYNGRPPSFNELSVALRTSPFGSCVDVYGFMLASQDSNYVNMLNNPSADELDTTASMLVVALMLYTFMDMIIIWLIGLRVIGFFVLILFIVTRDMDRLYSLLSLGAWVARGQNSLEVSNLSFRDPYLFLKVFSLSIAQALPKRFLRVRGMWSALRALDYPVRLLTAGQRVKLVAASVATQALAGKDAPFASAIDYLVARDRDRSRFVVLSGGVGLGKSTVLVAGLLHRPQVSRVFLLVPTNLILTSYSNDWVDPQLVQKVSVTAYKSQGFEWASTGVIVMTHGLARRLIKTQLELPGPLASELEAGQRVFTPGSVFLIDEVGEESFDVMALMSLLSQVQRLVPVAGMSATPTASFIDAFDPHLVSLPSRKKDAVTWTTVLDTSRADTNRPVSFSQLMVVVNAKFPSARRMLFVHPSLAEVVKITKSLGMAGIPAHDVSSLNPVAPPEGTIVATTIVDTGVTISPAPEVLVDFGLSYHVVPSHLPARDIRGTPVAPLDLAACRESLYRLVLVASSRDVDIQRKGRVGRIANAHILSPDYAGTGPRPSMIYPFFDFLEMGLAREDLVRRGLAPEVDLVRYSAEPYLGWVHFNRLRAGANPKWRTWSTSVSYLKALYVLAVNLGGWHECRQLALLPDAMLRDEIEPIARLITDVRVGNSFEPWMIDCARACCQLRRSSGPLDGLPMIYGVPAVFMVV